MVLLKKVEVQATVTSDVGKTYTYVLTNMTKTKTMTAANQIFDADPVLTTGTKADLTLSTTAADVAVTRGDLIRVVFTGGTASGLTAMLFYFENQ